MGTGKQFINEGVGIDSNRDQLESGKLQQMQISEPSPPFPLASTIMSAVGMKRMLHVVLAIKSACRPHVPAHRRSPMTTFPPITSLHAVLMVSPWRGCGEEGGLWAGACCRFFSVLFRPLLMFLALLDCVSQCDCLQSASSLVQGQTHPFFVTLAPSMGGNWGKIISFFSALALITTYMPHPPQTIKPEFLPPLNHWYYPRFRMRRAVPPCLTGRQSSTLPLAMMYIPSALSRASAKHTWE